MEQAVIRTDAEAWAAYPADRWAYNRLELAQREGIECGPAGIDPWGDPKDWSRLWWMKPIINLDGMGLGSRPYQFPVPPGHFWMPRFMGEHLSLDFERIEDQWRCILAVRAMYDERGRIVQWSRLPLEDCPNPYARREVPAALRAVKAPVVNIETIGGHLIEAHLRPNPDWCGHDWDCLMVVWDDDPSASRAQQEPGFMWAREDCDQQLAVPRRGFVGSHFPPAGHVPLCPDKMSHCPDKEAAKRGSETGNSGGRCPIYPWEGEPE
ncbi:MAG: hypothetical protein IOD10_20050 [Rhodocyclaceae bacterium]|nr:hypothetical protein [Rhodocyclaceae bacterium]